MSYFLFYFWRTALNKTTEREKKQRTFLPIFALSAWLLQHLTPHVCICASGPWRDENNRAGRHSHPIRRGAEPVQDEHRLPRQWRHQHMLTQHADPSAHVGSGGYANTLAWKALPNSGVITRLMADGSILNELSLVQILKQIWLSKGQ